MRAVLGEGAAAGATDTEDDCIVGSALGRSGGEATAAVGECGEATVGAAAAAEEKAWARGHVFVAGIVATGEYGRWDARTRSAPGAGASEVQALVARAVAGQGVPPLAALATGEPTQALPKLVGFAVVRGWQLTAGRPAEATAAVLAALLRRQHRGNAYVGFAVHGFERCAYLRDGGLRLPRHWATLDPVAMAQWMRENCTAEISLVVTGGAEGQEERRCMGFRDLCSHWRPLIDPSRRGACGIWLFCSLVASFVATGNWRCDVTVIAPRDRRFRLWRPPLPVRRAVRRGFLRSLHRRPLSAAQRAVASTARELKRAGWIRSGAPQHAVDALRRARHGRLPSRLLEQLGDALAFAHVVRRDVAAMGLPGGPGEWRCLLHGH